AAHQAKKGSGARPLPSQASQAGAPAADPLNATLPPPAARRPAVRPPAAAPDAGALEPTRFAPPATPPGARARTGEDRESKAPQPLPEQFGRYRLIKRLGQGGMGAVYLAHDTQLDRPVALKVPFITSDNAVQRERFFREARGAATLQHPCI